MSIIGEIVGDYVGEVTWKRDAGMYFGTGPRGVVSVAEVRDTYRGVRKGWWLNTSLETDAHGFPITPVRTFRTLAEAKDAATPILCHYRPRRRA